MEYIYESPDNGNTIYRRPIDQPDAEREIVNPDEVEIEGQIISVGPATIDDLMNSYDNINTDGKIICFECLRGEDDGCDCPLNEVELNEMDLTIKDIKVFVYTNKIQNYVSGQYYFIAMTRTQADVMAKKFAIEKEKNVAGNRNYMVEWDDSVKEFPIKPGYIPLNRTWIESEKP